MEILNGSGFDSSFSKMFIIGCLSIDLVECIETIKCKDEKMNVFNYLDYSNIIDVNEIFPPIEITG